MADAKGDEREWSFVNLASPADLKKPATKRVIRSYTTRLQHEKAGKKRRTEPPILPSPAPVPSSTTPPSEPTLLDGIEDYSVDHLKRCKAGSLQKAVSRFGKRQDQWTVYTPLYDNAHFMPGATNFDPFTLCPVPYKPWFAFVIDHWHNRVMPVVAYVTGITWDLDNFRTETQRSMWSDPALFYIGLLACTAIPISEGVFPLGKALWAREKAIQALNEALADSARVTSTQIILAIGLLAYHEHRHGNRAFARDAHRPMQHELIKRRGKPLDISNSHLKTCSFMDAVMAAETNTPKYFALAYETISLRAKAVSAKDLEQVNERLIKPRRPHPGYDSGYESDNWSGQKPENEGGDGVSVKHEPPLSPSLAVRLRETAPS